jgi:Short C-terminal domain
VGYLVKAGVGLALFFGGIVLFNVQLQELLDIGTCASGNVPYEISQPCPEGTGTKILLLMGSVIGALIGAAIFAFRGDPPWGERKSSGSLFGYATLAWGLFFAGTGAALIIGQPYGEIVDPNTGEVAGRPDSQLGSTITGITFLVMGVPALLLGLWGSFKTLTGRDTASRRSRSGDLLSQLGRAKGAIPGVAGGGPSSGAGRGGGGTGDSIGRLERLQRLKESGAINQSEFEREKAKILSE